jgi:CheY-like chemotaxis protein
MPDSSLFGTQITSSLRGRRVLVVEDEYMLAEDLRADLERQGAEVMGPVASVADALELLRQGPAPTMAILDINLGGEMVYPVGDALRTRGVPFLFATGYDPWSIPEAYRDVPRAEKPVELRQTIPRLGG